MAIRTSGAVRTARVTVEVSFTITDRATEGEMVDAAQAAVRAVMPELRERNSVCTINIFETRVETLGQPGGSL